MTKAAIKNQIHEAIEIIESEEILKAIYLILSQELKHNQHALNTFTLESFLKRNSQSQKEIKAGKIISHHSVKAKFKS